MEKEQQNFVCKCPLCNGTMGIQAGYYVCDINQLHRCLPSEVDKYRCGEITRDILKHRAKIRFGKKITGR